VLSKFEGKTVAKDKIIKFKTLTTTADLTDKIIETSLAASFVDFEDALQHYCAVASECSLLITRNGKDFKAAHIPILTPDEYLKSYRNKL
jgi:predicted nucleic acid-binding protein